MELIETYHVARGLKPNQTQQTDNMTKPWNVAVAQPESLPTSPLWQVVRVDCSIVAKFKYNFGIRAC